MSVGLFACLPNLIDYLNHYEFYGPTILCKGYKFAGVSLIIKITLVLLIMRCQADQLHLLQMHLRFCLIEISYSKSSQSLVAEINLKKSHRLFSFVFNLPNSNKLHFIQITSLEQHYKNAKKTKTICIDCHRIRTYVSHFKWVFASEKQTVKLRIIYET